MALDKESPDKESSGAKGGMGAGGKSSGTGGSASAGGGTGTGGRDKGRSSSGKTSATGGGRGAGTGAGRGDSFGRTSATSGGVGVGTASAAAPSVGGAGRTSAVGGTAGTGVGTGGDSIDKDLAPAFDSGAFATSTNQRLGYVETPTGAIPERPATIDSFGNYTPGTGVFGATGQYNDPNARMTNQGQLSQYGLIESELPSKWGKAGSLLGGALGPGGSMLGGMAGTMADAAAAKAGMLEAGMEPDIAEKIAESTYGGKAVGNLAGGALGGLAAEAGYNLAGQEGAMTASTATKAGIGAATDAAFGGEYNAADVAGLSDQVNTIGGSGEDGGPWFERVAQQLESPSQAVAGQPGKESIAPAIPTRLNYLEDSLANSAMQYASNANYQPRAVYSNGASSGASGTYYGNAPSSGTVINI